MSKVVSILSGVDGTDDDTLLVEDIREKQNEIDTQNEQIVALSDGRIWHWSKLALPRQAPGKGAGGSWFFTPWVLLFQSGNIAFGQAQCARFEHPPHDLTASCLG